MADQDQLSHLFTIEKIWTLLSFLISLGVLTGLWELFKLLRASRVEKEQSRNHAYDGMHRDYLRFLELTLQYAHLGANSSQQEAENLNEQDKAMRHTLYEMLFSVMEQAYLNRTASPEIFENQWPGWDAYIRDYLERPSCRESWETRGINSQVG
jgi:hypothetical protein